MKFGVILTAGDPRQTADLAALAEASGWDGVFTWDGISVGAIDTYDPWVVMAAWAMRTKRVTLGAIITPPSRRRPWKLAREAMSIDRLSNGRIEPPSITELPDEPGARLFALARFVPIGEADRLQILTAPGPAERSAVVTECVSNAVQLAQWRLDSM